MKKEYWTILLLVVLIFILSSNIAWVNPRPDFMPTGKISESIPVMWQYNKDAMGELGAAAFFPHFFEEVPVRVNRPTYPVLVHGLSLPFRFVLDAFTSFDYFYVSVGAAAIAYVILKLLVYFLGGLVAYLLLRKFMDKEFALFGVSLLLFHKHAIIFVGTYHTSELQFIMPILIGAMFYDICKNYSHQKNVFYSLIVGVLLLAKQIYATYFAVLLMALLWKKYKEGLLSFVVHLIPLGVWMIFLKVVGIAYRNHESAEYGQVVWLYKDLLFRPFFEIVKELMLSLEKFFVNAASYYLVFLVLFGVGWYLFVKKEKDGSKIGVFCLLLVFGTWLQMLASRYYVPYISGDFSIFVFGFSVYFLREWFSGWKWVWKRRGAVLFVLALVWLVWNVLQMAQFPWVSPFLHGV